MTSSKQLIIGGNGFLGSHVARQLLLDGQGVRVMVRRGSNTKNLEGLDVEYCYGDIFDQAALKAAMDGCDVVYYCVVDTRAWLRDTSPLFRTNVDGLKSVLDVAIHAPLKRFVFTSSIVTIARSLDRPATEEMPFNWSELGGGYVQSRVEAENLLFEYVRDHNLPAVAMCVANTYGPHDYQPTPHGALIAMAARGKMPLSVAGIKTEVVGVEDAARALILAAAKGRNGERYIISESFQDMADLYTLAATSVGAKKPLLRIPLGFMYCLGAIGNLAAAVSGKDLLLTTHTIRMMHIMTAMDHSKAGSELGWHPEPVEKSIARAAQFYTQSSL